MGAAPASESAKLPHPHPRLARLRLVLSLAPQGLWPRLEEQESWVLGRPQTHLQAALWAGGPTLGLRALVHPLLLLV